MAKSQLPESMRLALRIITRFGPIFRSSGHGSLGAAQNGANFAARGSQNLGSPSGFRNATTAMARNCGKYWPSWLGLQPPKPTRHLLHNFLMRDTARPGRDLRHRPARIR